MIHEDPRHRAPLGFGDLKKGLHDAGVELVAGFRSYDLDRDVMGSTFAIRAVTREGVVSIHESEGPCMWGDGFTREAVRIATTVPALVVRPDDVAHPSERGDARKNVAPEFGVASHLDLRIPPIVIAQIGAW